MESKRDPELLKCVSKFAQNPLSCYEFEGFGNLNDSMCPGHTKLVFLIFFQCRKKYGIVYSRLFYVLTYSTAVAFVQYYILIAQHRYKIYILKIGAL